jgi:anti-sigma factor RsiW
VAVDLMAMVPEQQRLSPAERANLVAYLDGELPEAEAQVIATKLTHSATARREAELLQKTWELLEHLDRPQASEALTERTLTEVRQIVERGDRLETAFLQAARRALRNTVWIGVSLLALAAAFALVRWVWPSPSERLARELPIAEHLDEYRDVDTFEFLDELANSPEFGVDRSD